MSDDKKKVPKYEPYHIDGYDDDGYEVKPKKGWFQSWLDEEKSEDSGRWWGGIGESARKSTGALSDYWSGRWGGVRYGKSEELLLADALRAVRRVGRNIYGGKVHFTWQEAGYGGKVNKDGKQVDAVTLDPTLLRDTEMGWSEGERTDGLVGETLLKASDREHVQPTRGRVETSLTDTAAARVLKHHASHPNQKAIIEALGQAGHNLYNSAAKSFSARQVLGEFPGYAGYMGREHEFTHRDSVKAELAAKVEEALSKDPRHLTAASLAAMWQAQTAEPLCELPGPMQAVVDDISTMVREGGARGADLKEIERIAKEALNRLADFTLTDEEGEEGDPEWESEASQSTSDQKGGAQSTQVGDPQDYQETLDDHEAENAEGLVDREFQEEDTKKWVVPDPPSDFRDVRVFSEKAERDAKGYRGTLAAVRSLIAKTRGALSFRNERQTQNEVDLRRGMVDEGGLHKLAFGNPRVFARQEIVAAPDVLFGMLVDQSGSMYQRVTDRKCRIDLAREAATLLANGAKGLRGVDLRIWGHRGDMDMDYGVAHIERFYGPGVAEIDRLGSVKAGGNNYDSFALGYCVQEMTKSSAACKILLVLCDGIPAGHNYGGDLAKNHVAQVAQWARRHGVEVYCLGIGNGLKVHDLERMYGKGNWQLMADASVLPKAVGKLLTKALRSGRLA